MRCKWFCATVFTVAFAGQAAGCEEEDPCARFSETYEISGEVSMAGNTKSTLGETADAPIVLQAFESESIISCSETTIGSASPGRSLGELVLSETGAFDWELRVEGYENHRAGIEISGFLDSDEDGACTPGELFASGAIAQDGTLKIEFKAGQSCQYRF